MKHLLITQRVEAVQSQNETRDSLDQRWVTFLLSLNILPIIIPNNYDYIESIISEQSNLITNSCGLIISGGQDDFLRNKVEIKLLEWAINCNKTVLGVCHGMQLIQKYFNAELNEIDNHINVKHDINFFENKKSKISIKAIKEEVLYHQYGTDTTTKPLETIAKSTDGIIMAIKHYKHHVYGIMWHPERNGNTQSKQLIQDIF